MNELAILVPVLRRPHRVEPLLESITAATPKARVVFICNSDDSPEIAAVRAAGAQLLKVDGNYAKKINDGVVATTEPLLFFGADDLAFHQGWFEAARAKLSDAIGVVGTQDQCNARTIAGEHSTHFLVARWYTELGTIDGQDGPLFEGYLHEFVDDEFVATAKAREAWAFADDAVVEHLHPMVGKAPTDELYDGIRYRMRVGRRLYRRRQRLWT